MTFNLTHWQYIERPISIMEAALLIYGIEPPSFLEPKRAKKWNTSKLLYDQYAPDLLRLGTDVKYKGFAIFQVKLLNSINCDELPAEIDNFHPALGPTNDYVNPALTTITIIDLAKWVITNKIECRFLKTIISNLKKTSHLKGSKSKKMPHLQYIDEVVRLLKEKQGYFPEFQTVYKKMFEFCNDSKVIAGVEIYEMPEPPVDSKSKDKIIFSYNNSGDLKPRSVKTLSNYISNLKKK